MKIKIRLFLIVVLFGVLPLFGAQPGVAALPTAVGLIRRDAETYANDVELSNSQPPPLDIHLAAIAGGGIAGIGLAEGIRPWQDDTIFAWGPWSLGLLGAATGGFFCLYIRKQNRDLRKHQTMVDHLVDQIVHKNEQINQLEQRNQNLMNRNRILQHQVDGASYCNIL